MNFLIFLGAIIVVVGLFNIFIFVHELGHFLAAKWRGLVVDKFYVWFGKPIWKKTINGVEYGLGSVPAGGYVALPQMAPMEAVEGGDTERREELPPIKPIDKIIVAAAGPAFSLGLALFASCLVWIVGKPKDFVDSTEVGYVAADSPAEKAGMLVGDKIISINGKKVNGFLGSLDSVHENIMLSEGKQIEFLVERPGEEAPLTLKSSYIIPKTKFYQRTAMREVGIDYASSVIVSAVPEPAEESPQSPAQRAGIKVGDIITHIDDTKVKSTSHFTDIVNASEKQELSLKVIRDGQTLDIPLVPLVPVVSPLDDKKKALIGIGYQYPPPEVNFDIVHPNPFEQMRDGLRSMWITITKVISPRSNIGVEHLAGPVGISKMMYDLLLTKDGWMRLLSFVVILNVNLGILNLMPLPVLDGGHIVLATGEWLSGRPVKVKILEVVQTGFAIVLLCLFLFITSRDIGDNIPGRKKGPVETVWPA